MLNLVRSGPRQLIIECKDINKTFEKLISNFTIVSFIKNDCENYKEKYHDLTKLAQEKKVIIHLSSELKPLMGVNDFETTLLTNHEVDYVLINILNNFDLYGIIRTRLTPKLIVMKSIGDFELFFESVKKDINATEDFTYNMFDKHSSGTFIAFSNTSINYPVAFSDLNSKILYTEDDYTHVIKTLRTRNLKYLNAGVNNQDWYELKIKIYDSHGHFDLHYKRLMYVLDKLDYGLVLGESWGTDAALVFLSVGIYKVRLFTFLDPIEIKKLLVALEFLEDGTRVVDYDLYLKRKKIHWDDLRTRDLVTRSQINAHYHKEIYSILSDDEKKELKLMEDDIRLSKSWSR